MLQHSTQRVLKAFIRTPTPSGHTNHCTYKNPGRKLENFKEISKKLVAMLKNNIVKLYVSKPCGTKLLVFLHADSFTLKFTSF